jgi:hypothetical protein
VLISDESSIGALLLTTLLLHLLYYYTLHYHFIHALAEYQP